MKCHRIDLPLDYQCIKRTSPLVFRKITKWSLPRYMGPIGENRVRRKHMATQIVGEFTYRIGSGIEMALTPSG